MNISLNLSQGQLSKLRNGHGIRINPTMFGSGVDLIVDPMTYHNMAKKLDKNKGVIIKLGMSEIDMNKMEGTGLFAGSGNKSGKISRHKKAGKWLGFVKGAINDGMDLGERGLEIYNKQKERASPFGQIKRLFGGELEGDEMEGEGFFDDAKDFYKKKVRGTKVGKAIKGKAEDLLDQGYSRGVRELQKRKGTRAIGDFADMHKGRVVRKAVDMSGLGLRVSGNGKIRTTQYRPAVVRPDFDKLKMLKHGKGMRMSGGMCQGCGMMNDHFIFADQAL